jgi:SAM-dependent methyltransferase
MQLIKDQLKRLGFIRNIVDFKNSLLIKGGLQFHMYDSVGDIESREFLKEFLPSKLSRFEDNKVLKVLVLGSPGLQEIKDLPLEILNRLYITCVDKSTPAKINIPLYKHNYLQMNIFDFFNTNEGNEKYDIIISRWFFHHVSGNNKEEICRGCYKLLKDKGFFILIDWFIEDWETMDELFDSVKRFYDYRIKYYPQQSSKMTTNGRDKPDYWWDNMHNDDDWSGGKLPSRKEIKNNLDRIGFHNVAIYEVANQEIIDDPHLWGHVLVYADKKQK